jgi:hypothetical protein
VVAGGNHFMGCLGYTACSPYYAGMQPETPTGLSSKVIIGIDNIGEIM